SSRGPRLDPEFRYLSQSSRGIVYGEYLYEDQELNESRSFVEWRHAARFRPRPRLHIDAANVSDPAYFEDFGAGFEGTSITFLNRSAELRHDTRNWSLIGRAQDYQVIDELLADVDQPYTIAPQLGAYGRWVGRQGRRVALEPGLGWRIDGRGSYVAADAALRHTGYTLDEVDPGF